MSDTTYRPALDDPNAYVLYRYIVFVVVFGLTTLAHVFQLIKKKTWYFTPLVVGGLCKSGSDLRPRRHR
jgi:hypothetical protein